MSNNPRNLDGSSIDFEQDRLITFEEDGHRYTVDGLGEMRPVSNVVKMFFPEFDAQRVSLRKCGGNVQAANKMQEQWKAAGSFASQAGTYLHRQIEQYINHGTEPQCLTCTVRYCGQYVQGEQQIDISSEWGYFKAFDQATTYQPFRTEWAIFDPRLRVAGTVDLICARPDGTYELYDWKRSAKTDPDEVNPWQSGINGLEHLTDTSYSHYCLQQNLYRHILETNYGLRISRMHLVVLHPKFANYKLIPVPRMEAEVQTIISRL